MKKLGSPIAFAVAYVLTMKVPLQSVLCPPFVRTWTFTCCALLDSRCPHNICVCFLEVTGEVIVSGEAGNCGGSGTRLLCSLK